MKNMKWFLVPLFATVASGCLSSGPRPPVNWLVEFSPGGDGGKAQRLDVTAKLYSLDVRSPYNSTAFAVLRPDGSVAFDGYNVFASKPSSLLKGAALDALSQSGRFSKVIPPGSSAYAQVTLELTVTRLALDCRKERQRDALAEVTLLAVVDRKVVGASNCAKAVPVEDARYSDAFSRAVSDAVREAASSLEIRK